MAGGWGSKKNGIRIGAFWDGIQISTDGSQARITDPRVAIDRDVNIVDSSNSLSWSGGAVIDGSDSNLNLSGSGEKRIKNVSGQWQDLEYGSTKTATFSATLSGVNYAGGTLTVSKSVTFPARAIDPPAAPTGLTATVNAATNTASISWTNNATTSAPYTSLKLERSSNGGATWVSVPLTGTPTSFSNTGLVANSRYRYRIAAVNSSGTSAYTTMTTDGYTTPSAPSNCTAAKNSSGNIVVSWLDNSAHETGFEVWHSSNGGTSWDASPLTTQSAGATSWTHVSPNTGTTHTYRIRAVLGGLVSGYSTQSNTVQLLTKPLTPTLLEPSSGSALDTAISNTFTWRHNSADTTAQIAYELRHAYSTNGGTTWSGYTTVSGTVDQFRAFAAAYFTPGRLYKWNVRTKGQHVDFSDWSADFTFIATTAPSATWVSPTNGGIVDSAAVTAQWTYTDAESEPQSRYRLTLVDENGNTIETIDTASAATSQAMSTILQNNRIYVLRLQVWDSSGLASSIVSVTFQTQFPTPYPAIFGDTIWDPGTGSVSITWLNPSQNDIPTVDESVALFGDSLVEGLMYVSSWEHTPAVVASQSVVTPPRKMWIPPTTDPQCAFETTDRNFPQDWTYNGVPRTYYVPAAESVTFPLPAWVSRARVWVRRTSETVWNGGDVTVTSQLADPVVLSGAQTDPTGFMTERIEVDDPGEFLTVSYAQKGEILGVEVWEGDTVGFAGGICGFGVSGQNSAEWSTAVHRWGAFRTLLSEGLQISKVLIAIMVNDAAQDVSVANYTTNISAGIDHLRDYLPDAEIVGVMMPSVGGRNLTPYNTALEGLCDSTIDATSMELDATNVGPDGTHWTDAGAAAFAGLIAAGLRGDVPEAPETVANSVYRSEDGGVTWETVATGLANDSTVVDYGPKLDTEILYRIVSVSAMNTVATSDIESPVDTRNSGQWVFFNVGPAWATWAKVRIGPEYDYEFERPKQVYQFAKRDDSVELIGRVRKRTMAFSAVIEPYVEQDAVAALLYVADQEAPIMYRDTRGRKWFVSIGPVKLSTKGLTTFSTQLTYVGRRNVG